MPENFFPPFESFFEIQEEIGRGGFMRVHRARERATGATVVAKVFLQVPSEVHLARLGREIEILKGLEHPNLARFFGVFGNAEGEILLVYEYCPGPTLESLRGNGDAPERVVAIFESIAEGLEALHQRGHVFRDMKPENVILTDGDHPKLVDFGLVYTQDRTRVTKTAAVVGTLSYLAPELILGCTPQPSQDIYALAVMAYELFSGETPFRGPLDEVLLAHVNQEPQPWGSAHPRLEEAVLQGLAKDPEDRPPSARAFARTLRRALELAASSPQRGGTEVLAGDGGTEVVEVRSAESLPSSTPRPEVGPRASVDPVPEPVPGSRWRFGPWAAMTLVGFSLGLGLLLPGRSPPLPNQGATARPLAAPELQAQRSLEELSQIDPDPFRLGSTLEKIQGIEACFELVAKTKLDPASLQTLEEKLAPLDRALFERGLGLLFRVFYQEAAPEEVSALPEFPRALGEVQERTPSLGESARGWRLLALRAGASYLKEYQTLEKDLRDHPKGPYPADLELSGFFRTAAMFSKVDLFLFFAAAGPERDHRLRLTTWARPQEDRLRRLLVYTARSLRAQEPGARELVLWVSRLLRNHGAFFFLRWSRLPARWLLGEIPEGASGALLMARVLELQARAQNDTTGRNPVLEQRRDFFRHRAQAGGLF